MPKIKKFNDESINLIDTLILVWEGKWKIFGAIIVSIIFTFFYLNPFNQKKNFTANTKIYPISSFEEFKYNSINMIKPIAYVNQMEENFDQMEENFDQMGADIDKKINQTISIPKVTRPLLFKRYVEILEERTVVADVIRKMNLLDASQYPNDKLYHEAIKKIAASIIISKIQKQNMNFVTIKFVHDDIDKWQNILLNIDKSINRLVKKNLQNEFQTHLSLKKQHQDYAIKDFEKKIENLINDYKIKRQFDLELLETNIDNLEKEYDVKTYNKLAYLNEQLQIAKELNIKNNTIEVQTLGKDNTLISNVTTESPFYLRGWLAINKEIELIKLRVDKKPFIEDLPELDKKRRMIKIELNLIKEGKNLEVLVPGLMRLVTEKRRLVQDETLKRDLINYENSPLADNIHKFTAASIKIISTEYMYKKTHNYLFLAAFIGFIIGLIYVIIYNSFQLNSSIKKKKTS